MQEPPHQENPQQQWQQHTSRGSSPQWQQNEPLRPQYPQQMPPPQPQWQQPLPPQQQWYVQHPHYGQPQQYAPYDQQQPQWGQQLPPPSGQPFYRQPPYGVSPSPDFGQSQQPKKRSRRWLWITLAVLGGIVAFSCVGSTIVLAVLIFRGAGTLTVVDVLTFLVTMVGIGLIICFMIVKQYILLYGDLVEGRIIEHQVRSNDEGTSYVLTYTYEYRGKTYTQEQGFSKKVYGEIPDGTRIRVRCLPKHPKRARIDERWNGWSYV